MSEGRLKSEDNTSPLDRVRRMAMPQLMWVDVESGSLSPLSADITDGLSGEVVFSAGAWEDKAVSFAAAKRLKKSQRAA